MRKIVGCALTCALILQMHAVLSAQAATAPAAPAKPLTTCEGLARDWKAAEQDLAESYAEGVTDDSAPRATMRAVRNQNSLLKAQIALALMRDNKCSLPKRVPSSLTYMLNAMKCRTEKMKGNFKSPECDYSTWTPIGQ